MLQNGYAFSQFLSLLSGIALPPPPPLILAFSLSLSFSLSLAEDGVRLDLDALDGIEKEEGVVAESSDSGDLAV